jgi:hypothetical protein
MTIIICEFERLGVRTEIVHEALGIVVAEIREVLADDWVQRNAFATLRAFG